MVVVGPLVLEGVRVVSGVAGVWAGVDGDVVIGVGGHGASGVECGGPRCVAFAVEGVPEGVMVCVSWRRQWERKEWLDSGGE